MAIGRHKATRGFTEAIALGVLCNALVWLAIWLDMGGRTMTDKMDLSVAGVCQSLLTVAGQSWAPDSRPG